MSWRDDAVDRLEKFCGLNPEAVGVGRKISPEELGWWVNRTANHGPDSTNRQWGCVCRLCEPKGIK